MTDITSQATLTDRTILAGSEALAGRRRGLRTLLPFAGPAVIASVAYMDPGNFATNIQAGAKYDYNLLWVVVIANIIAMIFQALSAKLGIVTGRNLAELCREQFPQPLVWGMWVGSEIGAMDHVEVVDPQTVRVVMKRAFSPFVAILTDRAGMMLPPKAAETGGKDFGLHPVCAGPFRFVALVKDEHLTVEAFDKHWRGAPRIQRIVFKPIPERRGLYRPNATQAAPARISSVGIAAPKVAAMAGR